MDTSLFSPEAKGYIDQEIARARAPGAYANAALRNRAWSATNSNGFPTGVTNNTALILMAAMLSSRASGIFQVSFSLYLTGITATDTTTISVSTQTVSSGMSVSQQTAVGPGSPSAPLVVNGPGAYVSAAAGGILINNGGGTLQQMTTGAQVAPTGGTTYAFSYSGLVMNGAGPGNEGPRFPLYNQVIAYLTLQSTHSATITYAGYSIDFYELP